MAADKKKIIDNLKNWITLDTEIKHLQKLAKEKRKEKKMYTEALVNIMRDNEIDCFDIQDGKLLYTKKKVKAPLSKKHLLTSLTQYFKNDQRMVEELSKYIMESRQEKEKENIKRKIKK